MSHHVSLRSLQLGWMQAVLWCWARSLPSWQRSIGEHRGASEPDPRLSTCAGHVHTVHTRHVRRSLINHMISPGFTKVPQDFQILWSFGSLDRPLQPLHWFHCSALQGGRLLICSMHQPRQELMRLFDARPMNVLSARCQFHSIPQVGPSCPQARPWGLLLSTFWNQDFGWFRRQYEQIRCRCELKWIEHVAERRSRVIWKAASLRLPAQMPWWKLPSSYQKRSSWRDLRHVESFWDPIDGSRQSFEHTHFSTR